MQRRAYKKFRSNKPSPCMRTFPFQDTKKHAEVHAQMGMSGESNEEVTEKENKDKESTVKPGTPPVDKTKED